jgi:hypothetical protein
MPTRATGNRQAPGLLGKIHRLQRKFFPNRSEISAVRKRWAATEGMRVQRRPDASDLARKLSASIPVRDGMKNCHSRDGCRMVSGLPAFQCVPERDKGEPHVQAAQEKDEQGGRGRVGRHS